MGEVPGLEREPSEAGDPSADVLSCPKCGGTSFKVKRRRFARAAAVAGLPAEGLASDDLLGRATHVKCVTCSTVYKRAAPDVDAREEH